MQRQHCDRRLRHQRRNIITYLTHPITNATSESINAKIQWVKYTARGFRNKQNFINAIYFHSTVEVWTWLLGPTKNPVGPEKLESGPSTNFPVTRL